MSCGYAQVDQKVRSVWRETRRRLRVNVLWAAEGANSNGWADRAETCGEHTRSAACSCTAQSGQRAMTVPSTAPKVLLRNVYGWFIREERGLYALSEQGRAALGRWPPDDANTEWSGEREAEPLQRDPVQAPG